MTRSAAARAVKAALSALALSAGALAPLLLAPAPALAQSAADKAVVDAAKAQGEVGEQADGYLGLVTGSAGGRVQAAVAAINAGRAEAYRQAGASSGASAAAAGQAAAQQLQARTPPGQFIRTAAGAWERK